MNLDTPHPWVILLLTQPDDRATLLKQLVPNGKTAGTAQQAEQQPQHDPSAGSQRFKVIQGL